MSKLIFSIIHNLCFTYMPCDIVEFLIVIRHREISYIYYKIFIQEFVINQFKKNRVHKIIYQGKMYSSFIYTIH